MAEYDTIVVGAGSAGCALAARLTEDLDRQVLLLEGGGSDRSMLYRIPGFVSIMHIVPQVKKTLDWGYRVAPQTHALDRIPPYPRGKVLGGSSAINGMLWVRGNRANYDAWAAEGCVGWAYDDVLPLLQRMESFEDPDAPHRGGEGPIKVTRSRDISPVSEAFHEAVAAATGCARNPDYNGPSQEGVSRVQMSAHEGVRYSTSQGYLQPALSRPNLTVQTDALVHRVLIEGGRATGVEWSRSGALHTDHAASEVVLCAGAVGSPAILQRSGVGPAALLQQHDIAVRADLPVGENLHDHLFFPLTFLAPKAGHRGTPLHFAAGIAKELLFGGTWFSRTVFEVIAFIKTDPSLDVPDLQLHSLPWAYPAPNQDSGERPEVDLRPAFTVQPTLIYPRSRGTLRITSSQPGASPHIDPNFLADPADRQTLVRGIEITRDILAHQAVAPHIAAELEPGADFTGARLAAEVSHRGATVYHPVGTCRMGVDDRAVVDPRLAVRGIDGLHVADASVFPSITGGNTNVPSILVGERCADILRE